MGDAKDAFRSAARKVSARSERRRRGHMLTVRFTESEAEIVRGLAERTGLAAGALLRRALLNAPPPPPAHHAPVDIRAIDDLIARLEDLGARINQDAKRANMGQFDHGQSIRDDISAFSDFRLLCLQAIGFERDNEPNARDEGSEGPLP